MGLRRRRFSFRPGRGPQLGMRECVASTPPVSRLPTCKACLAADLTAV